MAYRVSGKTGLGASVSVIVPDAPAAVAKLQEFAEDGIVDVAVKDLDGKPIELPELDQ